MIEWIGKRLKKNNKGFTLIELVVVIAILGILIGIAVPRLSASRKTAAVAAHNANVKTIESAATMYIADGGEDIPETGTDEQEITKDGEIGKYLQEVPEVPKAVKKADADAYKITITNGGDITVTPGLKKISDDDDTKGEIVDKNPKDE